MVDFHCHILPGVDDGSKSVEQSLQMLHLEQQQGVDAVILTPHFTPTRQTRSVFWKSGRRPGSGFPLPWSRGCPGF